VDLLLSSPAFLLLVLLLTLAEALWRKHIARRTYDTGAALASLGVAAGNFVLKPITGAAITAVFLVMHEATPLKLAASDWRVWIAGFVAVEFVYYWFHRWSHAVRWLWASHAVHHSATEMVLPAAIRLGWTSIISGGWLLFVPLVALGLPPVVVAGLLAFNLAYQFLLHTEAVGKLGPLEWVLNTPSHHRVHHAANPAYLDRNFGGVVIVFDRLFGTFAEERAEDPPRYGLVHAMTSRNPFTIALHEWSCMARDVRQARNANARWRALFGRPV
jgi:sterol desaturase/sphingolipid hydroxylase (fatty acid hydroxylase superfamily)